MEGAKEFTYKDALRKKLALARKAQNDRAACEKRAAGFLLPLLKGDVMVYVSVGSELSTTSLIHALLMDKDVRLWAPYTKDGIITPRRLIGLGTPDGMGNLDESLYGADKPEKIDYCVTPLLGFNGNGYRIGYGKGCYDRFFKSTPTYKIGLAFDLQRVEFNPDRHDVPLDCCVTQSGVIYF